jgi:hypothetical protein
MSRSFVLSNSLFVQRDRVASEARLVATATKDSKAILVFPASPDLLVLKATKEDPVHVVNQASTASMVHQEKSASEDLPAPPALLGHLAIRECADLPAFRANLE